MKSQKNHDNQTYITKYLKDVLERDNEANIAKGQKNKYRVSSKTKEKYI